MSKHLKKLRYLLTFFIVSSLLVTPVRAAVDGSFNAGNFYQLGGTFNDVEIDANGNRIFVGSFDRVNEQLLSNIVRVDSNGTIDINFTPQVDGAINQIVIQNDGKILIAKKIIKEK